MFRIISRLDIKNHDVINTVSLEGLRKCGCPLEMAEMYYLGSVDEIIFNDLVASLYGRNSLVELVNEVSSKIFVPLTVAGGIRTLEDAENLFKNGADKIAVNTAAVSNPSLINLLVKEFGSQAIVGSIETSPINGEYKIFTDGGRELHERLTCEWIVELIDRGVGEILLTSVNRDGTLKGLDCNLLDLVAKYRDLPIIVSGGIGKMAHTEIAYEHSLSGVSIAGAFHTNKFTPGDLKNHLAARFSAEYLNL